jgi:hypothetical protein
MAANWPTCTAVQLPLRAYFSEHGGVVISWSIGVELDDDDIPELSNQQQRFGQAQRRDEWAPHILTMNGPTSEDGLEQASDFRCARAVYAVGWSCTLTSLDVAAATIHAGCDRAGERLSAMTASEIRDRSILDRTSGSPPDAGLTAAPHAVPGRRSVGSIVVGSSVTGLVANAGLGAPPFVPTGGTTVTRADLLGFAFVRCPGTAPARLRPPAAPAPSRTAVRRTRP